MFTSSLFCLICVLQGAACLQNRGIHTSRGERGKLEWVDDDCVIHFCCAIKTFFERAHLQMAASTTTAREAIPFRSSADRKEVRGRTSRLEMFGPSPGLQEEEKNKHQGTATEATQQPSTTHARRISLSQAQAIRANDERTVAEARLAEGDLSGYHKARIRSAWHRLLRICTSPCVCAACTTTNQANGPSAQG
jgi:hypothetical protein